MQNNCTSLCRDILNICKGLKANRKGSEWLSSCSQLAFASLKVEVVNKELLILTLFFLLYSYKLSSKSWVAASAKMIRD